MDSSTAREYGLKPDAPAGQRHARQAVILVHGLWTPASVFSLQGHWLRQRGYQPLRFAYPSVRATLAQNVQGLQRFIAATSAADIHLVGHSLGGLLILELLAQAPDLRLRRVVLLGTPCVDSHCARELAGVAGLPALLGRSIMEWLSRAPGATALPRSARQVGVLAGTRSVGLGRIVPGLPRPNDGVVALAETRLPGAADFIALPVAHSGMLASRRCAVQIASFLESGRFLHDQAI
jgi:pimeloyl-ACP methyl ester carboxylesterase